MNKKELLTKFMELGILVSPEFFENLPENFDYNSLISEEKLKSQIILEPNNFQSSQLTMQKLDENILKEIIIENKEITLENNENNLENNTLNENVSKNISKDEKSNNLSESKIIIKKLYNKETKKKEVASFVSYFRKRYESIKKILIARPELQDSISISRLERKEERQPVSIIGLVMEKEETKNGNIKLKIEDTTGITNVLITKTKPELFELANDLVHDEVIGITGMTGNKIIFCNNIILPEIPISHETKKSPEEGYAVFISDIHFGIRNFLENDFMKFIQWLNGEYGSQTHREIANKIKYLFITGDVVEGIGIYPGQEADLTIKDIYAQYEEAVKYFKMIPERIKVIICGGNHDAIRMSEPQPVFDKQISKGFYEIPNMTIVSNPAVVNIDSSENFPGFDVLMYHGFSFPYYSESVPSIRKKGGLKRCDLIMKYLLQKRHLAPAHGSTLYIPDEDEDALIIDIIPDIFVSGHIHQTTLSNYRGVTLINSSCWVVQSEDNAKRGIIPEPAKIPVLNLHTKEVKIMNFLSDGVKVLVEDRMKEKV